MRGLNSWRCPDEFGEKMNRALHYPGSRSSGGSRIPIVSASIHRQPHEAPSILLRFRQEEEKHWCSYRTCNLHLHRPHYNIRLTHSSFFSAKGHTTSFVSCFLPHCLRLPPCPVVLSYRAASSEPSINDDHSRDVNPFPTPLIAITNCSQILLISPAVHGLSNQPLLHSRDVT